MKKYEAMLEPFDARTLTAIRSAFQAGWEELCQQVPHADLFLRNRLVGAIANLAQSGIDDPSELKREALQRLSLGSAKGMADPYPAASSWHASSYVLPSIPAVQEAMQP